MITPIQSETVALKAELQSRLRLAHLRGRRDGRSAVRLGLGRHRRREAVFSTLFCNLTTANAQIGWANSCALIGCLVGALVAGALSDKFGRKRLLIVAALMFAVTSLGNALAGPISRFSSPGGFLAAWPSAWRPVFRRCISPKSRRRRCAANWSPSTSSPIVIGILLAQFINWFLVRNLPAGATDEFIRNSWFGQQGWRWMFGLTAAPALLFFIGMLFVPESPRWLAKNGKSDRARDILKKIGGENYARRRDR